MAALTTNTPAKNKRKKHATGISVATNVQCKLTPRLFRDGPGTELDPEAGTSGTIFPENERGPGTVATVVQEPNVETVFARTTWSQRKTQVVAKKCAKLVHTHSRKPHPHIVRKLCRCTLAQISHNLTTFLDAPHIFRTNFPGPVGNALRISFAQFSRAHGLFSKSASVQAMNVSSRKWNRNPPFL